MQTPTANQYMRESQEQQEQQMPMPVEEQPQQVQPQQRQEVNPFAAPQYQGSPFPDSPISSGSSVFDSLLSDSDVPEDIKKKYWYIFHKDNILTFLDENRKMSKLLNFDITKIDQLNSMPYYDYTFEKELEFGVLRNVFETKLDRALGFKGQNVKNERIVLQSQFSEQRQISEDTGSMVKEGFFKRLMGRRN